ncbi:hypothetical protein AHAS_Ahas02G0107400 [Arachis hypogaea]
MIGKKYVLFVDYHQYYFIYAGDLPVVISCASLALADVGIMMYDLVASVSAGMHLCLNAYAKLTKIMRSCLKEAASDSQE